MVKPNLGSRPRKSKKPEGPQLNTNQVDYQISFDMDAFDNFVRSQGVRMIHYRAIPDPRGMISRGDNRDVQNLKPVGSDGYIYKESGVFIGTLTSNSNSVNPADLGDISNSVAYMTLPRHYEGTEEDIIVEPFDKFYLRDIEVKVSVSQFMESNKEGVDRLNYPAVKVKDLIDANGVEYKQGENFNLNDDGQIVWVGQKRPGWNVEAGRGVVYSIRYLYTPFFVVDRLLHEIRVTQVTDLATQDRRLERAPYQVQLLRENVFLENKHPEDPADRDPRMQRPPQIGGDTGPMGMPSLDGPPKP